MQLWCKMPCVQGCQTGTTWLSTLAMIGMDWSKTGFAYAHMVGHLCKKISLYNGHDGDAETNGAPSIAATQQLPVEQASNMVSTNSSPAPSPQPWRQKQAAGNGSQVCT